jgi:hypothetical protein
MKHAILTKKSYTALDPEPVRITEVRVIGILVYRKKDYVRFCSPPHKEAG